MATTQTGTSGTQSGTRTSATSGARQGMMGQVPDTTYNLISVMYHTLQGCQAYEQYAQDAEQAGQQDIAQYFRDTGREFERCAERGQQLLAQCLQQGQMGQGGRSSQLSSQMSKPSGQQSQAGSPARGQQSQMGGARGQQGSSSFENRSSSLGSSGSTNLGSSGSNRGSSNR